MSLADTINQQFKRYLVQTQITCPITGKVLDVGTAKFSVAADGFVNVAFDPSCSEDDICEWLELPR